jgi:cation:H+ antiporter
VYIALAFVFSAAGFFLLWKGANWLVDGASRLALLAKLSPIIIGITIVAFGTSLPEMSVSIAASVKGEPGITLGNVVGSNVANILLVLGVAAVIRPLKVTRKIVTRDSMLVTGAGVILLLLALTGNLSKLHGLVMLIFFSGYMAYYVHDAMVNQKAEVPDVTGMKTWVAIIMTAGGIACILFGSDILVESAVFIASELGIPEVIIGLTMIAVGTSLPELATSAVASRKGESEISIGNVLGSNVFNILLVLGISALVVTGGIAISGAMIWDIAFMTLICLILVPTLWTGLELGRREGIFMLMAYGIYIASLAFRQGAL